MKVYRVGGSVRDELLGLPVIDRDFVVVGATPEEMMALGYQPVGRDFPVFLHPDTHEEYALARTERKSGRGHQGFLFHADPAVSLDDDLIRRDLTINAMARDDAGALIDPHGGQRDLAARTLRHVSPAFLEDPLRVLRVARFAARFGFDIAPETESMMRGIVSRGELADLSPERVWRELSLGLVARTPSRMLSTLRRCGALREIAPELDGLHSMPAGGVQPDLGVVTTIALDRAVLRATADGRPPSPAVQFGIAARHLSVPSAEALSARLKVGNDGRDAAINAARHADGVERSADLSAEEWLRLLGGLDVQRRPERLNALLAIVNAYAGEEEFELATKAIQRARDAARALSSVQYGDLTAEGGGNVADRARALRLRALEDWLRTSD